MAGIGSGFQALIQLGLLPFGEILHGKEDYPALTFNRIGRHQSRLVQTRVCSIRSPWMACFDPGEVTMVPISHGEGRFACSESLLQQLQKQGQIATQYVGEDGKPSYAIEHNPNGSVWAIEGITSPCGRILGKMGHSERVGEHLYKNVPGRQEHGIFAGAALYFK
jgi:phosphoribosylformylglycinamidine synthase